MASTVRAFVRACPVCQRVKDSTQAPGGLLQPLPVPTRRFSSWSMDFITHLPVSGGCNCIFTCVDRLTKLVRLTSCAYGDAALTAGECARLFFDRVVRDFGIPDSIVSDRDPRFTPEFWGALMQIVGTRLSFSSAFHPQTDGQTERAHRTIEQVLRAYVMQVGKDWYSLLGHCEFALNASVSASTGISPFELAYGQQVQLPVDHLDGMHKVQAAQDVVDRAQYLVKQAQDALVRAQTY